MIEWPTTYEPPPKSLSLETVSSIAQPYHNLIYIFFQDVGKLILYGVNPFVKVSLVYSKEYNKNLISVNIFTMKNHLFF